MRRLTWLNIIVGLFVLGAPMTATAALSTYTVTYGVAYSPNATADIYAPIGAGPFPAILVIHGGGFTMDMDMSARAAFFAKRGYVAMYVHYRLAPAWPFPAAVQDVRDAVLWLQADTADGVDPGRIAAFGQSAGGNLVYMASDLLRTAVAFSGPTDFFTIPKDMRPYLGCSPRVCPDTYTAASPLDVATPLWCPTFIGSSELDTQVPLDQATRYADELTSMGVTNRLDVVWGSSIHALLWRYLGGDVMAWLREHDS